MYVPTIGLEIHIELKTKTKMFCACLNDAEERRPNANVCPICLGHPGAMPVANRVAVNEVLRLGLAIGGKIAKRSHFDRKSYFYPDLPKGYQISQYDEPFVTRGALESIRITRVHLEEDAGRLVHSTNLAEQDGTDAEKRGKIPNDSTSVPHSSASFVDFNRAGVPLMELVTEPDIKSGEEAVRFAKSLQKIMRYLNASDADMEKGQMRVEVNISLREIAEEDGTDAEKRGKIPNDSTSVPHSSVLLGTKVEIKNLNSFKAVQGGIDYEIERQTELLEEGKEIVHETRGWDEKAQKTVSQRGKELSHDYRDFPEPDLPPMTFAEEDIEALARTLPELPEQKKLRFMREFSLSVEQAELVTDDLFWADYFEKAGSELASQTEKPDYVLLFNYLSSDLWGLLAGKGIRKEEMRTTAEHFASLVALVQNGKCTSRMAKDLLVKMTERGEDPETIMNADGIQLVTDDNQLITVVQKVIQSNPKAVGEYKAGKTATLQFLVGNAMKETRGQADPEKLRELFLKEL